MKKISKTFLAVLVSGIAILSLSSFVTPRKIKSDELNQRVLKAQLLVADYIKDGTGLSYKELVDVTATLKGSKLTLKEKVILKIQRKKISDGLVSNQSQGQEGKTGKSQIVAALLCFFLGGIGIHRFYLGYTWQGIVQILTLGGFGIWALIDLVRILIGTLKPKDGEYEKTL